MVETISRHMKAKKVIRSCQHGFTKGQSCWTNLVTFYADMAGLVDEGGALVIVYLEFIKVFDTLSQEVLTDKPMKYGLDEQTDSEAG